MEPHLTWQDNIKQRNTEILGETEEELKDHSNWFPFVENINDVCERMSEFSQKVDELENEIGEVKGMIRNLRKILIKLEVVDDRFVF
jgi:uncharacterized protein Yka (UPF0111/DUF47 family)